MSLRLLSWTRLGLAVATRRGFASSSCHIVKMVKIARLEFLQQHASVRFSAEMPSNNTHTHTQRCVIRWFKGLD